jgi:thiol-disulfide isomerase/thioredoxin
MKKLPNVLRAAVILAMLQASTMAADNLRLRDGISYFHDLDQGFPIVADSMADVTLAADKPAFLFFGASGDLNCNRQARRVVDLYKKFKATQLKFIIVNVDEPPNNAARQLIKKYYTGYIPTELFFDNQGKVAWSHLGEAELHTLSAQAEKVAGSPPLVTAETK